MFVALLAHADTAEPDWLRLQDASGTQTNENQRHNAQRVGVRMTFCILRVGLQK